MIKNYFKLLLFINAGVFGQITETFETRAMGASSFSNGIFTTNLTPSASFKIATLPGNYGYLSSANFIENTNASPCSLKATSTFRVSSLYLYPSSDSGSSNQTVGVDVIFRGKLANVIQFSYTPPASNFTAASWTNLTNRGFTLVDFSVPGYQNIAIDELEIDINSSGNYIAIDNYTFTSLALSTENFNFESTVKVFPNPSNGIYNLETNSKTTYEIYDLLGKKLKSDIVEIGISQFDLTAFKTGIYILKMANNSYQTKTIRLTKY